MKTSKFLFAGLSLSCAALAIASNGVLAQGYPSKPIHFVVPSSPGGANDFRARVLAEKLSQSLGQQVLIENKPGADGAIGMELVARSAPDGYTIVQTAVGSAVVNPALYKRLRYDPVKDFEQITLVIATTIILAAHPSLQVSSVKELVALAKSKPGHLNYATSTSAYYLITEMFKLRTGIDMLYVPYKGDAPAVKALIAGEAQVMFDPILPLLSQIKAGKVRPLAVASASRSPALPDVPTMAEAGLPGFEVNTWTGIAAPAGTPKEIVRRLNSEIVKVLHMPAVRERLEGGGDKIVGSTPEEFSALLKAELAKYSNVIKEAGIPRIDQ
ncbi:MAG: tripartite tricarboxylate transporter substrate binding protein [Betaproteobacteria bacterium]|nr:tripartite tricarboxylate transporter substrate binding protein [Betaproteobacteria bacterium]